MIIAKRKMINVSNIAKLAILTIYAFVSLFPVLWMTVLSLKPSKSIIAIPPDLSLKNITIENYLDLFKNSLLTRWALNSLIVAVVVAAGSVVFGSMAGYAFAKKEFSGKRILFWMVIGTMLIQPQVIMVPLFILVNNLGFINTFQGLILPVLVSPMYVFLSIQYMKGIHNELIYAARIDGCSEWRIFTSIIIPISVPVISIVAIFSFISQWNNFLWPLVVTNTKIMRTLPVGLASLQEDSQINYGLQMAGSVFATIPIVLIFFTCSKYFLKGITVGAIKG